MADQTGAVDLEALAAELRRDGWHFGDCALYTNPLKGGCDCSSPAIIAALERIPKLELENAELRAIHGSKLAMLREIVALRKRAKRLQAALATITHVAVDEAGNHVHVGLWVNHAKAGNLTLRREEYEVFRAALAPEGSELPPPQHTLEELGGSLKQGQLAPAPGEEGE